MLIVDKESLCIYDFLEVFLMDSHVFKIQMRDYTLIIRGHHLQMEYYDQKEIRLHGHVKVIEYDENRV
ncbi:YabP/YqfC family sporulation protein [Allocoprobacillus halotolerans]|uniref:YabP/YqfC family sporulation protein n=1 Tax=Allocoprobacillus halotolerans TaxID=2944914 RepID=A0ABY5I4I0_9FIRM|nr:YabP/YqfC family sporulation protein [Allocoprobacillus halotolerans]UTY38865.1 YabP/YqfC family sporulation protein [Allocoprobacillus halotolerans]